MSTYCKEELKLVPAPPDALCELGAMGTSAAGGAEDGPTLYRYSELAWAEGQIAEPLGACHAEKRLLVDGLPDRPPYGLLRRMLKSKPCFVPEVAPMTVLELSGRRVLWFPGEATTAAGAQLRAALGPAGGPTPVIAGLTNGYLQYVATADEYRHQQYEGASTLYGPKSLEFFAARAGDLVSHLRDEEVFAEQGRWVNTPPRMPGSHRVDVEGSVALPTVSQFNEVAAVGRNPSGDKRPAHASLPDAGPAAMPLELVLPNAGRDLWRSTAPWIVEVLHVTASCTEPVANRRGIVVDQTTSDVEVRLLPSFIQHAPVMVSWFPDSGTPLRVGDTYCLKVTKPYAEESCQVFTSPGWSQH